MICICMGPDAYIRMDWDTKYVRLRVKRLTLKTITYFDEQRTFYRRGRFPHDEREGYRIG